MFCFVLSLVSVFINGAPGLLNFSFFGFFLTTDGHSGGSFVPCTKSIKDLQVG